MQFSNGAITFTTNTSFSLVSSTNGLFGSVTTTNLNVSGALFLPSNSITDGMVINGLTIDGGTINNTPIGGTTPSTGVFTSLTSSIFFATDTLFVNASTTNLYVSDSLNLPNNSITNAMVADNITASNYLLLTGGTLSGQLIFTSASGTAITSTNIVATNLNVSNITSTNLYVSATTSIATTSMLRTLNVGGSVAATYYYTNINQNAFFSGDSGGIVFNGGYLFAAGAGTGLYVANGAIFRGGISNDTGASLTINGGTTGNTLINNTLTFNNATGTSLTSTNIYNNGGFYQTGLGDCDLDTQTVNYDVATGKFSCLVDGGGASGIGASTANYFAFYDSVSTVTGTPLMQLVNGAITFTTNTSFLSVSSTSALFYDVTTTNFYCG
jgi:hypothetical protein